MGMNRNKGKCGFVVVFFLLTLASPLLVFHVDAGQDGNALAHSLKPPHQKVKPDWNKNHYNWKKIAGNNSYVDVILSLDSSDLNKLDKNLQKKLDKSKDHVFKFAISGFNARLSVKDLEQILYENP